MTLSDEIPTDFIETLACSEFEEVLHYQPKDGAEREIRAQVFQTEDYLEGTDTDSRKIELDVVLSRDEDATSSDGTSVSGVARPQIGDTIRRQFDNTDIKYHWDGTVLDEDVGRWALRFVRFVPFTQGATGVERR